MKNLLSIESLTRDEIEALLKSAEELKHKRWGGDLSDNDLEGQCWAMIFSKSSTRTRVSFEVGIRYLHHVQAFPGPGNTGSQRFHVASS